MSHSIPYRYIHTDDTRIPRDMRRTTAPEVTLEQYYFVGYRISAENTYRYQHILLLADGNEALIAGITAEAKTISASHGMSINEVAPVFVRNLIMNDPDITESVEYVGIRARIQAGLSHRDDNHFIVLGLTENQAPWLTEENTQDALLAIRLARWKCAMEFTKKFRAIEVTQAHPVTKEFDAIFQATAKRIMQLAKHSFTEGHLLH